jgi:hypothetical protein
MKENISFRKDIARRMWLTKGSRYNACQRLQNKYRWSIYSISILTFYVLLINLTQLFPKIFQNYGLEYTNFVSLALSIFILIISLLESGNNYQVKAERLFNSANEVARLHDVLSQIPKDGRNQNIRKIQIVASDYNDLIESCSENHEKIDLEMFKTQYPSEFGLNNFKVFTIKVRHWFAAYGLYALLISVSTYFVYLKYIYPVFD